MSLEAEGENWTTTKETETNLFFFFFFLLFWSQCSSYTAVSDIRAFDFFCLVGDF